MLPLRLWLIATLYYMSNPANLFAVEDLDLDVGVLINSNRKTITFRIKNYEDYDIYCKKVSTIVRYIDTQERLIAAKTISARNVTINTGNRLFIDGGFEEIRDLEIMYDNPTIQNIGTDVKLNCLGLN